jgi:hypothetical protein
MNLTSFNIEMVIDLRTSYILPHTSYIVLIVENIPHYF